MMKQTEKIVSFFIIILIIIELLFDYPYVLELIIFSSLLLSILYFFFSFLLLNNIRLRGIFKKESYATTNTLRIIGTIGAGIALSIIVNGIIFKFNNWPFGDQNLMIGLILLFCIAVVSIIKFISTKTTFYRNLLIRIFIVGGIGLIFFMITSEKLIEIKFRDYPEYVEAEKELLKDPYNETLIQKVKEEREKMY